MELFDSYPQVESTAPFTMFAQYGDDGTLIKLEDEGSDSTALDDSLEQVGDQFCDQISLVEQSSPSESSPMMEQAAGEVSGMYRPMPAQQQQQPQQQQQQPQQSYVPQQSQQPAHQVFFPMNEAMRRNLQQQQQQQQRAVRAIATPIVQPQTPQPQPQQFAVKREYPMSADVMAQQPKAKRTCSGTFSLSNSRTASPLVSPMPESSSAASTTINSCVQELVKGKSEDVERFRNTLRCQGSLTPELEKQLKRVARQVKNRESAQLSRQRKREYVEALKDVIDRMSGAESALRSQLDSTQAELLHSKTEAERWQAYAHQLQQLALEHGLTVPREPEIPQVMIPQDTRSNVQAIIPEHLFDGPCGFGRRVTAKNGTNSTGASARHNSRSSK